MKKMTFAILACAAALTFTSCGNSTKAGDGADSTAVDSTKTFEQQQLEASVKMHLDSLAAQFHKDQIASIDEAISNGKIVLTTDQKKVKPVYLLAPSIANEVSTAGQKYAALAMLSIDKAVANLYDMDVKSYDEVIAKLSSDVNDPAIKKMEETKGSARDKSDALYKAMEEEGRINFFWIGSSAATVENLYLMTQNIDQFTAGYTDEQIANITFRLICIIDALDALSVYDSQVVGIAEALSPLKELNATTMDEFKKQLEASKEEIVASRAAFLK